ncbi:MAG: GNAT family N-acetyltransferase [Sphingomicrobium sp.]
MTVEYRDGQAGDGKAISALFDASFKATFAQLYAAEDLTSFLAEKTPATFESELASPEFSFRLAEENGVLAGYAKLGPNDLPGDAPEATLELYHLYVLARWHGRGIAPSLMVWTMDEARQRGATHLQLSVFVDNHRARRFYERHGFEEVGKYVFMVGNHQDDDRVMRLAL